MHKGSLYKTKQNMCFKEVTILHYKHGQRFPDGYIFEGKKQNWKRKLKIFVKKCVSHIFAILYFKASLKFPICTASRTNDNGCNACESEVQRI